MRIVTINTAKGDGEYARRLPILAEQLAALDPDVVALQESLSACDRSVATAPFLGEALGLRVAYARARRKPRMVDGREVFGDSGLALLTRRPLVDSTVRNLPWSPADGERIAQLGIVEDAAGPVLLVNLHLTHLKDASALRAVQLDVISSHPWLRGHAVARLLCGDFNATLTDPELASALDGSRGWDVRDAYGAGGGELPRDTIGPCNAFDGRAPRPRSIDYVLSLARRPEQHPRFSGAAVVLNEPDPDSGLYPSDHFGVAITMTLDKREPA